uniref:Cytochrome c oxidase polypeptide II n=1 Tax=Syphacia obvelata TaxID=412127 RepID=A0A0U3CJ84_SYPOB|nr:cytochrome c oxidase subunit 2 [Syphacia obvelata]
MVIMGSFYSSIYSLWQCYLLDFIISFMIFIMVFVIVGVLVLWFVDGGVKFWGFDVKMFEFWCGVLPVIVLILQVICSYGLIYYDGLVINNSVGDKVFGGSKLDIKIMGRQWFSVYEYSGLGSWMKFDSYLLGSECFELWWFAYISGWYSFNFTCGLLYSCYYYFWSCYSFLVFTYLWFYIGCFAWDCYYSFVAFWLWWGCIMVCVLKFVVLVMVMCLLLLSLFLMMFFMVGLKIMNMSMMLLLV